MKATRRSPTKSRLYEKILLDTSIRLWEFGMIQASRRQSRKFLKISIRTIIIFFRIRKSTVNISKIIQKSIERKKEERKTTKRSHTCSHWFKKKQKHRKTPCRRCLFGISLGISKIVSLGIAYRKCMGRSWGCYYLVSC